MLHSRSATPAFRVIRVFRGSKSQSEPFDITSLRSRVPPHLCVLCVLCGENPSGIQRSTTRSSFALIRAQSRSIAVTKGFKKNEPPRPCPLMPPHFLRFSFCALPRLACRAPVAAFELSPAAINYLRSTINCSQRPCSAKRLDETRPLPTLPASVSDMAPWVNHPQQLPFLRRR